MKAILDKEAIRIAYCAADLPYNLALQCVRTCNLVLQCVRIGEEEIAACDGFILAKRPIPTEPITGEVILVKAKDILEVQRKWKAKSLTIESDSIDHATITDEASGNTMETELVRGNFPNISKLFPATNVKAHAALSRHYLALISKLTTTDEHIVKLKVREATEPVEFTIGKTRGLVMPMFVNWEEK